jgi:hypothetical protein
MHWSVVGRPDNDFTHPINIRKWFNEQQAAAMWFAANWSVVCHGDTPAGLTHPQRLREWFNEQPRCGLLRTGRRWSTVYHQQASHTPAASKSGSTSSKPPQHSPKTSRMSPSPPRLFLRWTTGQPRRSASWFAVPHPMTQYRVMCNLDSDEYQHVLKSNLLPSEVSFPNRGANCVSESDRYKLIMRSFKQEAKPSPPQDRAPNPHGHLRLFFYVQQTRHLPLALAAISDDQGGHILQPSQLI